MTGPIARIAVDREGADVFRVTISEREARSVHRVTVPAAYYDTLTGGRVPVEDLVRLSFEFLLEREPKESILRAFELSVIARYFPEYEREIARRLG
jgi:hypothetical protein